MTMTSITNEWGGGVMLTNEYIKVKLNAGSELRVESIA